MQEAAENPRTKQVILIRKDLNMRKGKISAQAAHASRACLLPRWKTGNQKAENPEFSSDIQIWISQNQRTICLAVPSEEEIRRIQQQASELGLNNHLITDQGLTEFNGVPTVTALGIGPHPDEKFQGLTDHLPLL